MAVSPDANRHSASAVRPEEETRPTVRTQLAPPWNVIVHDDPVTLMQFVTRVLREIFGYPEVKATRLMLQVHNSGCAVVWTGAREQAEIYVQKLLGYHLKASLDRVDV